jgi:transposase InsO family protein
MISAPDRRHAVELIEAAVAAGARQHKACEILEISARTYQRWTQDEAVLSDRRPGAQRPVPANKLSGEEREEILKVANSPAFCSLPPSQIVPALADQGRYLASESTVYRVLREADQQHHRGRSEAPQRKAPSTHCAVGPNQVWCWDITWLPGPARGLFYYLYLILDLYSRKIIAWEVHDNEASDLAARLIHKACLAESIVAQPLVLHSDNGSPMKGASMLETLRRLGVSPSYSRPRVRNDNAYAESLFRTCKYRPDYPFNGFATIDEARAWVLSFTRWYNTEHKHSGLKFTTPMQRHSGEAEAILEHRKQVYRAAKARHPNRWSGEIRNWDLPEKVWLNPEKERSDLNEAA